MYISFVYKACFDLVFMMGKLRLKELGGLVFFGLVIWRIFDERGFRGFEVWEGFLVIFSCSCFFYLSFLLEGKF